MRLKLDENLGLRWLERLRAAEHDVDTVHDEGLRGATDPDVLEAAVAARRALVTLDLDFANPFRFPPDRTPGIVALRVRDRPGRQDIDGVVERLVIALAEKEPVGKLWIVDATRVREYQPPDV